jgi:hypothetical protein
MRTESVRDFKARIAATVRNTQPDAPAKTKSPEGLAVRPKGCVGYWPAPAMNDDPTKPTGRRDDARCEYCGTWFMSRAQKERRVAKRHAAIPARPKRDDGCSELPTRLEP